MISISMTDFVDFAISSGTPKLTKVRQVKNRDDYHPAKDFYRILRNGIIEFHMNNESDKSKLDDIVNNLANPKKEKRYSQAIRGYKRFLGRKKYEWFQPPSDEWGPQGISIKINPELGLILDGEPNIIKMYFKVEALSKRKIDIVLLMLYNCFYKSSSGTNFSILDVQRGKIFSTKHPDESLMPLLIGEAENFKTIWENI